MFAGSGCRCNFTETGGDEVEGDDKDKIERSFNAATIVADSSWLRSGFLRAATLHTATTRVNYAAGVKRVEKFARQHNVWLGSASEADRLLERLLESMFRTNGIQYAARCVVYGILKEKFSDLPGRSIDHFPRTREASRGWSNSTPAATVDSPPWEAVLA